MDQKQNPMTLAMVGALAGTVTVVAFLMLVVMGAYAFSPAAFLAILIGLVVAIVLFVGFHQSAAKPAAVPHVAPKPKPMAEVAPAPTVAARAPIASAPVPAPAARSPEPAPVAHAPEPKLTMAPEAAPMGVVSRPAGLAAPEGAADDLKQIKGVGPKLEKMLNGMGYWHFRQIGAWTQTEIAWVDENLEGFKGRVTRDEWVTQAKTLASGGGTAFSDKVKGGGVY